MPGQLKHGFSTRKVTHPIYKRWEGMNQRVNNPNSPIYKYYGGRGITICDEWREFLPFYNWAIQNGFSSELELDRIDGDGNYCPENCRWVDGLTNKRNVPKRKRNKPHNWGINRTYNDKFHVQVYLDGSITHVGTFDTEEKAIEMRDRFINREDVAFKKRPDTGIYITKSGTFLVHVVQNKKLHRVGTFKTKEEAVIKRKEFIDKM